MLMALFCICIGCSLSVYLQQDLLWDFLNYHYYNAFALIFGRFGWDIVPASINGFFNPIIELPLYFYIQHFNQHPAFIFALQGIWTGLLLFAFYKIVTLFIDINRKGYILLALALAVTGQQVFFQIGTSTNEIQVSFFMLWGIYYLLRMIKYPTQQKTNFFAIAGLIMGIGLGLKQTAIVPCLSAGLMLIFCFKYLRRPIGFILFFAMGGLAGYLLINGYFMYQYAQWYGNPFFPFLNGIFQSPYFDRFNYSDTRYLPHGLGLLFFPYREFVGHLACNIAKFFCFILKIPLRTDWTDLRMPIFHTLLWAIPLGLFFRKKIRFYLAEKPLETSLFVLVCSLYILWLRIFAIERYCIVFEMLGALLFVLVLQTPLRKVKNYLLNHLFNGGLILLLILMLCCPFFGINHGYSERYKFANYPNQYVYVEPVHLPENTLLKLYNFPTAGLIAEFAKYSPSFRAVGHTQDNCKHHAGTDFAERGQFRLLRDQIEQAHEGPVVIVYVDYSITPSADIDYHFKEQAICQLLNKKLTSLTEAERNLVLQILSTNSLLRNDCLNSKCPIWKVQLAQLQRILPPDYTCRKLNNNLDDRLKICVPNHLVEEIFRGEP